MIEKLESLADKILNKHWKRIWIRRLGNWFTFASAFGVTVSIEYATKPHLFVTYSIGALLWTIIGLSIRDRHLAQLNFVFLFLNTYAVYIRL